MKNIMLLSLTFLTLSSCSNMQSDIEKVCALGNNRMEIATKVVDLTMKVGLGDENLKKELNKLRLEYETMEEVVESIKSKYNEDEFQAALLENCEVAKKGW